MESNVLNLILYSSFINTFCDEAGTSWTAKNSDFAQQLVIDLGNIRNISRIALQGRPHSTEYVTEFTISYGYNGLDYAEFKEPGGNVKVKGKQSRPTHDGYGLLAQYF